MKLLKAGPATRLTFTPDSRGLVVERVSGSVNRASNYTTALWDVASGAERVRVPCPFRNAFLADGRLVGLDGTHGVNSFDPQTGVVARVPFRPGRMLKSLAASPDRTRVAGLNWYDHEPHVFAWSWPDLTPLPSSGPAEAAREPAALLFTAAGGLVMLDKSWELTMFDAGTGRSRWSAYVEMDLWTWSLAASPSGHLIAVLTGRQVSLFEAQQGQLVHQWQQPAKHVLGGAFTPDGRHFATVSHEGTVKVFDTQAWRLRHELAWQVGGLHCVAFSPDGMLAAAGGMAKKVVVWDLDL